MYSHHNILIIKISSSKSSGQFCDTREMILVNEDALEKLVKNLVLWYTIFLYNRHKNV